MPVNIIDCVVRVGREKVGVVVVRERRRVLVDVPDGPHAEAEQLRGPGGSVRGERANFTRLVLGCIDADFCK